MTKADDYSGFRFAGRVLLGGLLLSGGIAFTTPANSKTYTLQYADMSPPRGPRADAMKWWAAELEKRTAGQVKVKFHWTQSMVKGKEILKAVGSGLADAGTILGVYTPADLPVWNMANIPFTISDPWVGMRTWQKLRETMPELKAEADRKNVHILANFSSGAIDLISKEPIRSMADLQNRKIRATGGFSQLLKSMGATPVRIGFGEVYQALDRGTIDGSINYIPFMKAFRHYEVASHVTEVKMGQILGYGIGVNKKLWDGMSAELRAVISRTSDELIEKYAEAYLKSVDTTRAQLVKGIDGRKVTFHRLPDGEMAEWQSHTASIIDAWKQKVANKGIDGERVWRDFIKTRDMYRRELAEKGYPWTR